MLCWWIWFEHKMFLHPRQCRSNHRCIRNTTLVLKFSGATRNLIFADSKFLPCTLQSSSSFISLKDSHTVLVKKSRFALESGLSSRSHSFTAKLQIIPPHLAREAASQAHYVLSKSIWEERGRGALFWSAGADEYLGEIIEVSNAGEWEFKYSQRTAYQWCQINHRDPVSAWDWNEQIQYAPCMSLLMQNQIIKKLDFQNDMLLLKFITQVSGTSLQCKTGLR